MKDSFYKFKVLIPSEVEVFDQSFCVRREELFEWIWNQFGNEGLLGIHEGTLLSEEAVCKGFEVDSWTVDSAEAPRERDWIGKQPLEEVELYFSSEPFARRAHQTLTQNFKLELGPIMTQRQEDWDLKWKTDFLNQGAGIEIKPFWHIVPPWVDLSQLKLGPKKNSLINAEKTKFLKINPGAGFGTGTHETTQLCLESIGEISLRRNFQELQALDFGSGSGILSIGLALLGARVDAVEIDSLANDNALENARLNSVEQNVNFSEAGMNFEKKYSIIVANILKPVLLEFSVPLVQHLSQDGILILSGLIDQDIYEVKAQYQRLLNWKNVEPHKKGEWRSLVFS